MIPSLWIAVLSSLFLGTHDRTEIRIPLNDRNEVAVADLIDTLAKTTAISITRPETTLRLPLVGLGGPITKTLLADTLGNDVTQRLDTKSLVLEIPNSRLAAASRPDWKTRLSTLVDRAINEENRRNNYGMHALKSYRPNDPTRPTVCLIHGLNSTSSVFWHMVDPIEQAGYGIVVYDFPYNRDLDESAAAFARDWVSFRRKMGDKQPWAMVAHSMGALLVRSYLEDDTNYQNDVASLILIAPVNQGSNLSHAQTLLQVIQSMKAVNKAPSARGDALAHLGDGLGEAASDMMPQSAFLKKLNARKRRPGVPYHTLAGDNGFLSRAARAQIETQLGLNGRPALLGGLARLAAGNLTAQLDEIGEGTGDGAVSVAATKLDGVDDHQVLHVNHLELIRAPLLFPEPGPVVAMPHVLRWLGKDLPVSKPQPTAPK